MPPREVSAEEAQEMRKTHVCSDDGCTCVYRQRGDLAATVVALHDRLTKARASEDDAIERAAGLAARHADLLTTARGLAETGDVMLQRMTAAEGEAERLRAGVRSFLDARDSWDGADVAAADKAYRAEDALRALVPSEAP